MNTQKIKKFSEEYEKPKITEDDFRTLRAPVATFTILIFLLILFFFCCSSPIFAPTLFTLIAFHAISVFV